MDEDFVTAVVNLSGGCRLVADSEMGLEMVRFVKQPNGGTLDRLMREGWLERMPNGGTFKLSDEGVKAYMRYTDGQTDNLTLGTPNDR